MNVREIQAKTLLGATVKPDPWFGIKYTMNLYRGCTHRCIYCDSRSECYQIEDFDGEVLVKVHAVSINGSDWEGLRGKPLYARLGGLRKPRHPILGSDIAGSSRVRGQGYFGGDGAGFDSWSLANRLSSRASRPAWRAACCASSRSSFRLSAGLPSRRDGDSSAFSIPAIARCSQWESVFGVIANS